MQSVGRALGSVMNKVNCVIIWAFIITQNSTTHACALCLVMLYRSTSILAINGDMGWEPPSIRHKCQMLQLWNRLVKMSNHRLTKRIFNWVILHSHPWATELKSSFCQNDLSFIFQHRFICKN